MSSIHDEWECPPLVRAKALALAQGDLDRPPWGILMLGEKDPPPCQPEFSKPPPVVLASSANARDVLDKFFAKIAGPPTFSSLRREAAKLERELIAIDRRVVHHVKGLSDIAELHGEQLIFNETLEVFLAADQAALTKDVLARVAEIKLSPRVRACRSQFLRGVGAAHTFVETLLEFSRPTPADCQQLDAFS